MDILSYLRLLRRRWLVIGVAIVVGAGLGVASTMLRSSSPTAPTTPHYKATTTLLLDNGNGAAAPSSFTGLDQMAVLTTSGPVPEAVATTLGDATQATALAQRVTTLTNSVANTLAITAIANSPEQATQLADTFAKELRNYIDRTDSARYRKSIDSATARVNALQAKIDPLIAQIAAQPAGNDLLQSQLRSLENEYTQASSDLEKLDAQTAPTAPLTTLSAARAVAISTDEYQQRLSLGQLGENNLQTNAGSVASVGAVSSAPSALGGKVPRGILGALLGLLVGVAIAIMKERFDHRIRNRSDAEHAYGLPVVSEVPSIAAKDQRQYEILSHSAPMSAVAESYRAVRSALAFQYPAAATGAPAPDGRPLVVMVASAVPEEGKTTTAANLATVLAETGRRVLVVNCDFRRPMLHRFFGLRDEAGRAQRTPVPGVQVITNVPGSDNPAQVVSRQRQVIDQARGRFDIVILDTAPLLSTNDAMDLLPVVDSVVLVTRANTTTVPAARSAVEMLDRVEAPVLGLVLTDAREGGKHPYAYDYDTPIEHDEHDEHDAQHLAWAASEDPGR